MERDPLPEAGQVLQATPAFTVQIDSPGPGRPRQTPPFQETMQLGAHRDLHFFPRDVPIPGAQIQSVGRIADETAADVVDPGGTFKDSGAQGSFEVPPPELGPKRVVG